MADSTQIDNLPEGWIDGHCAFDRLRLLLLEQNNESDPAPWFHPVNADYWGPHWGQTPGDYVLNKKLEERLASTFQSALISGRLRASMFDGLELRELPKATFGFKSALQNALFFGAFDLDPLWPDDWQTWSGRHWAIAAGDLDDWIQSGDALRIEGLPYCETETLPDLPTSIERRLPTEGAYVPLSEAVTWIAFGMALDASRYARAVAWERLFGGNLQILQRKVDDACARLFQAGADGHAKFIGRHVDSLYETGVLLKVIDPLTLLDYQKAMIDGHNHLYFGKGLFLQYQAINHTHVKGSVRSDHYMDVAINRADLLSHYPDLEGSTGILPPNRKLNHPEIISKAAAMKAEQPTLSKGSAAASIVADLPKNPRTHKRRDTRHIERIIAHLWGGGLSHSPPKAAFPPSTCS